jgi:hypothetical protein
MRVLPWRSRVSDVRQQRLRRAWYNLFMDRPQEEDRLVWEPTEPDADGAVTSLLSEEFVRLFLVFRSDKPQDPLPSERVIVF